MNSNKNQCCPKFDPKPWEEKTHIWKDKLFIKESLPQFFHIPFPPMVGRMIQRLWKKAQDAKAAPEIKDFLWKHFAWDMAKEFMYGMAIGILIGMVLSKIFIRT